MLALAATVLSAYSQETPHFLEPIDPIGFNEKEILELLRAAQPDAHPTRVEVGYTILWVYWRNIHGHHILKLRKDRVYQRDLPPSRDPFEAPDVPYEDVFTLALSKVVVPNLHQLEGIDVKTTQTSVPDEVADRLMTLWDALTRTLQYRTGYSGGGRHRYEGHFFIAGLEEPPSGRRIGGVHAPTDGPLFDFANISVKLHQLVEPVPVIIDPFKLTVPKKQPGWSPELLQREIIASCKLLEAKLKKR